MLRQSAWSSICTKNLPVIHTIAPFQIVILWFPVDFIPFLWGFSEKSCSLKLQCVRYKTEASTLKSHKCLQIPSITWINMTVGLNNNNHQHHAYSCKIIMEWSVCWGAFCEFSTEVIWSADECFLIIHLICQWKWINADVLCLDKIFYLIPFCLLLLEKFLFS